MSICSNGRSRDERRDRLSDTISAANSPQSALKPLTVSVKTARQITGLGNTTIYQLIGDGTLESVKVHNKRLIVFASLERLATPAEGSQPPLNPAVRATAARLAKLRSAAPKPGT